MAVFPQELRFAVRRLKRAPGFFATAILLIAVGIAASTAIFALVNAFLLRPLPVQDPQNLVQLFQIQAKRPADPLFDYGFYQQVSNHSSTLMKVVGQQDTTRAVEHDSLTERVHVLAVTDNYFSELGVTQSVGRLLESDASHEVVLSYRYWQRSFGGDKHVIGQIVRLQGHPYTIIGVTSEEFTGTLVDSSPDLWMPFHDQLEFSRIPNPNINQYVIEIVGRLRPGVSPMQAQRETGALWDRYLHETNSDSNGLDKGWLQVLSIQNGVSPVRNQSKPALLLLFSGTGLLLLMVCTNVGGLLLARATAGERETAVRIALGASRLQLVKIWLLESALITAIGGLGGLLLAYAGLPFLARWLPPAHGIGFDPGEIRTLALRLQIDFRVVAFSLCVCLLTTLLCAVAPAWRQGSYDLSLALKNTVSDHRNKLFQTLLCGFQIALCTTLLVCAGLVAHSLSNLQSSDSGFDRDHVALFSIDPHVQGYDSQRTWSLQNRLLSAVERLPGVEADALAYKGLMRGIGLGISVVFPGQHGGVINTSTNEVTPGYFKVMGIRLLAGRNFDNSDQTSEDRISHVIVNEAFVRKFLRNRNPIGEKFDHGKQFRKPNSEIIGVVSDTKYRSLREVPPPIVYSDSFGPNAYPDTFILHISTRGDPKTLIEPVRQVLRSIDPNVPVYEVGTLSEEVTRSLWQERLLVALSTCFGGFSLLLAAISMFGILAYFVARRQREIGIRMALGATPRQVIRLVVTHILPTLVVGALSGAFLSWLIGGWIQALLYGVQPLDPWATGTALLLLISIGLCSSLTPALKAIHVDPASVLRQD